MQNSTGVGWNECGKQLLHCTAILRNDVLLQQLLLVLQRPHLPHQRNLEDGALPEARKCLEVGNLAVLATALRG